MTDRCKHEIVEINLTGYEPAGEPQPEDIREIVSGHFTEGEKVTVNIDGHIITRKVFWSGYFKDLAIRYNNLLYTYSEFWN